jgi:hypothetical protein
MSYQSIYLNSSLPENAGLGTQVWLLKIPRTAASLPLLGSLVQNIDDGLFNRDYPAPWPMTDMGLFLTKIQQLGAALILPLVVPADPTKGYQVTYNNTLAGITLTLDSSSGLDLSASGNIPGVPLTLNLGVNYSETSHLTFTFGPGSRLEYIPTDYLCRLSKYCKGNPKTLFPNVAVSIPKNRIVDVVVIGTNYSLEFTQKTALSSSLQAQFTSANATAGGKFSVTATSDTSFKITVTDNVDYLIGLQTINWDQLDSE